MMLSQVEAMRDQLRPSERKLADYVIVTAQSGVSKSLLKPGMYTSAFPAVDHADWNKSAALMRNLDKLRDRIKALEAAVANASGDKA